MNHSCCPNVVWSYSSENPLLKEVRAVKEIVAGEELCPNYINSFEVIGLFLIINQTLSAGDIFFCSKKKEYFTKTVAF